MESKESFRIVRWRENPHCDVVCVNLREATKYVEEYNALAGKQECYVDEDIWHPLSYHETKILQDEITLLTTQRDDLEKSIESWKAEEKLWDEEREILKEQRNGFQDQLKEMKRLFDSSQEEVKRLKEDQGELLGRWSHQKAVICSQDEYIQLLEDAYNEALSVAATRSYYVPNYEHIVKGKELRDKIEKFKKGINPDNMEESKVDKITEYISYTKHLEERLKVYSELSEKCTDLIQKINKEIGSLKKL
jgi:chromosome segregation ATPase